MIKKIKTNSHEEWLALRHQYIGGSDCATIIGMNKFSSPYNLWAEKVDLIEPFKGNLATEVGTFLEPFVAQRWAETTGKKVRNDNLSFINDQYPWAIANIDRKVEGESAGLECKTCSELRMKEFKNGEYPENYYSQCVHYLAVTGYQKWYLAVLVGNKEFLTFEIERDENEIKALMDAESNFWYTYVIPKKAPPVDGHAATTSAIKEIYQKDDESTVDLFGMEHLFKERNTYTSLKKDIENKIDECDNQIRQLMGSASYATCSNYSVTWKMQRSAALDREAIKRDYPGIDFSKYSVWSRRFTVREKKGK